jgi:hypothetical protein
MASVDTKLLVVVDELNKVKQNLTKVEEIASTVQQQVGPKGDKGDKGDPGPTGKDGADGRDGKDGVDGKDGLDGKDGVSVVDASVDFDNSLVLKLSDGNIIDAGNIIPESVKQEFNSFMTRGEIIPTQSGNSGKYLTTDGNNLAWTSTGNFTSVALDAPTTDATLTIDTGITSWVYSGKTVSVSGQETNPQGVFIGSNGTKMYVCGSTGDDVNEYTLGTAWDVSTATFTAVSTGVTQDTAPVDIFFKDDGLTMFVLGGTNDTVYQYTLSVAWNITTATYASKSFSVTTQETAPNGMWFKSDGTTMYIVGTTNDTVYQYTLSTPWDISTASYASISFSVASQETSPLQVNLSADGTKMWVTGPVGDDINEYTLGTAWNVSTATFVNNVYIGFQETSPTGLFIDSTAANRVYVTGNGTDAVYQYNTVTNTIDATTNRLFVSGEGYVDGNFVVGSNAYVDGAVTVQGSLTAASTLSVASTLTGSAAVTFSTTTSNISIGTSQTTGTLTLGGTSQTGTITVGQSTGAQTLNFGTGATTNGTTKTINIGTAGVSGSTTTINIGSAVSGALGNISMGNSGTQFLVAPTTSAVNYVQVTGSVTGVPPVISAQGSDTNVHLTLLSKGSNGIRLSTAGASNIQAFVSHTASAVNYVQVTGAVTGGGPIISTQGSDTNAELKLRSKGIFNVLVQNGAGHNGLIVDFTSGATTANYFQMYAKVAGSSPSLAVLGTDTNIDLALTPKGTGLVSFGTHTATALTISGYVEIKDSGGTIRKLAVVT